MGTKHELSLLQEGLRVVPAITLSNEQLDMYKWYRDELIRWNEKFNLTAITDPRQIESKHFLDSLTCLQVVEVSGKRVIDLGTGAGLPGLALRIACPGMQLTLVEATGKKVDFCRHVVRELKLNDVQVIHARAEEVGQMSEHREYYDIAVARAVAQLPVLLEYMLPLVAIGGRAIAQKGETAHSEVQQSTKALGVLGGRVSDIQSLELPGVVEIRHLVVVDKLQATPGKYPRRPGIPARKPLM